MAPLLHRYLNKTLPTLLVADTRASLPSPFDDQLSVSRLTDGRLVAVWSHDASDGADSIRGRLFSAGGTPLGAAFAISTLRRGDDGLALNQTLPSVAALQDGGFIVSWTTEEYNGGFNPGRNVLGRIFDANGNAASLPFVAAFESDPEGNVNTGSWEHDSALARLTDGRVAMAYADDGGVVVVLFNPDGTRNSLAQVAIDDLAGRLGAPSVAAQPDGGFVLVWQNALDGGAGYRVSIQRFAADGTRLGSVLHSTNPVDLAAQSSPKVTMLADGRFVVSWDDYQDYHKTVLQLFETDGSAAGAPILLRPAGDSQTGYYPPDFVATADGGWVAVYATATTKPGNIYADMDIYAQRYAADGTALGSAMRVNPETGTVNDGDQHQSSVSLTAAGDLLVTWYSVPGDAVLSRVVDLATIDTDGTAAADFVAYGNANQVRSLLGGDDRATSGSGDDRILGGAGADTIDGGAGHDLLRGDTGADELYGAAGNDTLMAGDQADKLYGGLGADALSGGGGADLLRGGLGRDALTGGAGADRFVFATAAEAGIGATRDSITDFQRGIDKVDLSALNLAFIGTEGFHGVAGEVRYAVQRGDVVLFGDLDGNGAADFALRLAGLTALDAADLIL